MTVPCENVFAAFPASQRAGNATIGPMTLCQAVLLGAFDVPLEVKVPIPEDKVVIAAMLLSPEWRNADRLPVADDFKRFAKQLKANAMDLAEAVASARAFALSTYVKPPKPPPGARVRTTPHGCGWPLEVAEFLCGEYGWSWREALATPVVTAFALVAASRQRHGDEPGGFDYVERIEQRNVHERKRRAAQANAS
ncbi:MAG: hypothetical protein J6V72_20795 [Kiritimatiellae bacterium]|nr:hypothetical protein [Kiritimatiellia bacterium]